jgi:hypothetical protein
MLVLTDFLASLPTITTSTVVAGLFVTASLMVLLRDWPQAMLALVIQYLLFGWLLAKVIPLPLALIKVLTGAIACLILYWSARRIGELPALPLEPGTLDGTMHRQRAVARQRAFHAATGFSMRLPFRVAALLLAALATYGLATRYTLPGLTAAKELACTWLIAASLILLAVTESPLRMGMGLLTWLMAFEMFYVIWEHSVTIAGLLGIVTLFVALGAGYLTSVRGAIVPSGTVEQET